MQKKKKEVQIKSLNKRFAVSKNKRQSSKLKTRHGKLAGCLGEILKNKKRMKKRFEDYVKNSGYVPPKSKKQR